MYSAGHIENRNSRVLVTGGAGYIGSHACKALANAGYEPIVFDNLVRGNEWAVRWGPLEIGDITDQEALRRVIERYRPSAVMHFAAFAYVGESVEDPAKYYRNNLVGTLNVLEAMRNHGPDKIIFSSTCATYGIPDKLPINEESRQNPINPYGRSKLMIETILREFADAYKLRWSALRYFNAAGADPEGELGECHLPETHLIPLVLDTAAQIRDHITINGADYDTSDGTCIRDYVHVGDIADAHVRALGALENGQTSDAFNLGNGQGYSILQVIEAVQRVTGLTVKYKVGPRRPCEPSVLVSDATKAAAILGWKPETTNLDEIVQSAWKWHQQGQFFDTATKVRRAS